jgi:hypothetical protein
MEYLSADLLPKVFHGLIWIIYLWYTSNTYVTSNVYIVLGTQSQSHMASANTKKGLSYGRNALATIQYHWIHIQWKVFDGGFPFANVKCLNINLRSNALI